MTIAAIAWLHRGCLGANKNGILDCCVLPYLAPARSTASYTRRRAARMTPRGTISKHLDQAATLLGVIIPFAAVIVAAVMTWERLTTWRDIAILAVMYMLAGLGITVGFHRMLTHR